MPPGSSLTLNSLQLLGCKHLLSQTERISAPYILHLPFYLYGNFCICGIKTTPGSAPAAAPALAPRVHSNCLFFILRNRLTPLLASRVFPQTGTRPLSSHRRAEDNSLDVKAPAGAETGASWPLEDSAAVSPEQREWILPCRVCRGTSQAICHSRHVSVCVWRVGGWVTGKWSHRSFLQGSFGPSLLARRNRSMQMGRRCKQVPSVGSTERRIAELVHLDGLTEF